MRLVQCYGKMNIINKEKTFEVRESNINYENLGRKVKTFEEAVEKNKNNLKSSRENTLIKGNKLMENLELIENKIKNIIENLPNLENDGNNFNLKKQISLVRNNLLNIERNLNLNKNKNKNKIKINPQRNIIKETENKNKNKNKNEKEKEKEREKELEEEQEKEEEEESNKINFFIIF
jgi:hypothetical protein